MNELKFNSQICTSIEQSQRLLELGLNPETADMFHVFDYTIWHINGIQELVHPNQLEETDVPAWSLHRLLSIGINGDYMGLWNININIDTVEDLFEQLIKLIEWTIKDGVFNKEYLKQ